MGSRGGDRRRRVFRRRGWVVEEEKGENRGDGLLMRR